MLCCAVPCPRFHGRVGGAPHRSLVSESYVTEMMSEVSHFEPCYLRREYRALQPGCLTRPRTSRCQGWGGRRAAQTGFWKRTQQDGWAGGEARRSGETGSGSCKILSASPVWRDLMHASYRTVCSNKQAIVHKSCNTASSLIRVMCFLQAAPGISSVINKGL